jgi:hypothetical protein
MELKIRRLTTRRTYILPGTKSPSAGDRSSGGTNVSPIIFEWNDPEQQHQEAHKDVASMEASTNEMSKGRRILRRYYSASAMETSSDDAGTGANITSSSTCIPIPIPTIAIAIASMDTSSDTNNDLFLSPNYCIKSDLDHVNKRTPVIVDSHTSYRKIIDDEITMLKFKLAKSMELADSLDNELKKKKVSYDLLNEQHYLVTQQRLASTNKIKELETILIHLQDNVRESALERAEFVSKQVQLNESCLVYQHSSKICKSECKRLKKDLVNLHQDMEGKNMENQGLRSENDWLKNQLWPGKACGQDSDSETDTNEKDASTTIKQIFSPLEHSLPKYQRRRRKRVDSKAAAVVTNVTDIQYEEDQASLTTEGVDLVSLPLYTDGEDRTAGYTSLTDFQLKSASESGIDITNVITKDKNRQNSFIRKLALRHGVSASMNAEDGNSTQSYRSIGDNSSLLEETKATKKWARQQERANSESASFKSASLDNNCRQPSFKSSLSNLQETDPEHEIGKEAAPWSLWGILTGVSTKGEAKTKELSDSSHSSVEFIQHVQKGPYLVGTKMERRPSAVLVPKRLAAVVHNL